MTTSHQETTISGSPEAPPAPVPVPAAVLTPPAPAPAPVLAAENKEFEGFDEFDPRSSFKGMPLLVVECQNHIQQA